MNVMTILGSIFSPKQLIYITIIAVVIGIFIIANIVVFYLLKKHRDRKLCTQQLQQRRDMLLDHLANITDDGSLAQGQRMFEYSGQYVPVDDDLNIDIDDDDDFDDESENSEEALDDGLTQNMILAVADMSEYTRKKLGFVGEEYDDKSYFVRCSYGFDAKIRVASDEIKERYCALIDEFLSFKGVSVSQSFRAQRVHKGRKTLAQFMIRGKTLCVAFALDPQTYADTKYRGIDKSGTKSLAKTPLMYKITSARRFDYARHLILQLAEDNTLVANENYERQPVDFSHRTLDELFVANSAHITILREASVSEVTAEPEIVLLDSADQTMGVEEEPNDITVETPGGTLVIDRSFTARIIQADDDTKARYSELKNHILSYKGVRSKIGWKRESFLLGGKNLISFAVRGKTLMLYLALDSSTLDGNHYLVVCLSELAINRKASLLFRVKDDIHAEHAKLLIDKVLVESGAEYVERKTQDYTLPYKPTDALVKRDLIKITTQRN